MRKNGRFVRNTVENSSISSKRSEHGASSEGNLRLSEQERRLGVQSVYGGSDTKIDHKLKSSWKIMQYLQPTSNQFRAAIRWLCFSDRGVVICFKFTTLTLHLL